MTSDMDERILENVRKMIARKEADLAELKEFWFGSEEKWQREKRKIK
jgi:hypothetical protein